MRRTIESGKVVSSHSSTWGTISRSTKARIDSRRRSWSSPKMKWRRRRWKSGLTTGSEMPMWTRLPNASTCALVSIRALGRGGAPQRSRPASVRRGADPALGDDRGDGGDDGADHDDENTLHGTNPSFLVRRAVAAVGGSPSGCEAGD